MMKRLVCALMFVSTVAYAEPDVSNPYMYLGDNTKGTVAAFIGARNGYEPILNKHGVTIIRDLFIQRVGENGYQAGSGSEGVVAVLCDKQVAKTIELSHRTSADSAVKEEFKSIDDALDALNEVPFAPVTSNTLLSGVIDAGCNYVRKYQKPTTNLKQPDTLI